MHIAYRSQGLLGHYNMMSIHLARRLSWGTTTHDVYHEDMHLARRVSCGPVYHKDMHLARRVLLGHYNMMSITKTCKLK